MSRITREMVMTQRLSLVFTSSLLVFLTVSSPGLACMEDEAMFVPMEEEDDGSEDVATVALSVAAEMPPRSDIECDTDLACPSGMICEPVNCCEAEGCDCPAAVCVWSDTGAQGRD